MTGATSQRQKHNVCVSLKSSLLECHQAQERFSAYRRAKALQTPFTNLQLARQEGSVVATGSLLSHSVLSIPQVCPTAFKVAENEEGYVFRYYNMSQEKCAHIRTSTNHS